MPRRPLISCVFPIRNTLIGVGRRKPISACCIAFLKVNGQEQERYNVKALLHFWVPLPLSIKERFTQSTKVADLTTYN